MHTVYNPNQTRERHPISSAVFGTACVLSVFALLPLLSTLPSLFKPPPQAPVTTHNEAPPRIIPIIPKPPIVDDKKIDKPEIEKVVPPVDLTFLEKWLNPSDNGVGVSADLGNSFIDTEKGMTLFLSSEVDKQPRVLVAVQPLYPYSLRGESGEVIVEFIIEADGRVKRPRVVKSSRREFEQPAIDSVVRSKWQAGQKNGENVRTLVRLPVQFRK